jgi:hypothetical protein
MQLNRDIFGVVIRLWLVGPKNRRSIFGRVKRFFCSPKCPDRLWGPPNLLFRETGSLFPRAKRPWREDDNSLPSSAEVKSQRSCAFTPPIPSWLAQ